MNALLLPLFVGWQAAVAALPDDLPAARVVLPWSDFKGLVEKGLAPENKPDPAPWAYTLSRATYSGRVDGESVIFTLRLRVEVIHDKTWTVVPLLPGTVALKQARLAGKDAPIWFDGSWYQLVTNQKGPLDLDLEFAVSTFENAGQSGFAFPLPRTAATEITVAVPAKDALDFSVAGAQQVVEETRGGDKIVRALLPSGRDLAVSWQKAAAEAAEGKPAVARVYAEHQALIGISEGLLHGTSLVQYSILHAGVRTLRVSLPADTTIVDVTGKGIDEWKVVEAAGRKIIDVGLTFEATGAYTLRVDYERPLPEGGGEVNVPQLIVANAERVKGFIGVDARSTLEIAPGAVVDARPVDVRELPAAILGQTEWPVLLGFSTRKEGWSIPLVVRPHQDVDLLVTLIDQVAATTALTPDGRRMTRVTYALRNNRAQYLRLALPEKAELWSTFVAGKAVKPARAEDGRILVPLARSQTAGGDLASFAVELVYVEDGAAPVGRAAARFSARLPTADAPATAVAWTVLVPRGSKVPKRSVDGTLRRVESYTLIDLGGVTLAEATRRVQAQAEAQFANDAMGAGVDPVRVSLPVDGEPVLFEKLLVLDEELRVGFDWKAPKSP